MTDNDDNPRRASARTFVGGVFAVVVATFAARTIDIVAVQAFALLLAGCGFVAVLLGAAGLVTDGTKRVGANVQRRVSGEVDPRSTAEGSSASAAGAPVGVRALHASNATVKSRDASGGGNAP